MKNRIQTVLVLFLVLMLAAGSGLAEGNEVYTSGDFSCKLDTYGQATVLSMSGATDTEGLWLVPKTVNGHPVQYLSADCIPEDVCEILMPGGCKNPKQIELGAGVKFIDLTAFADGAKKLTVVAPEGSYAAAFAAEAGYKFKKAK